MKYSQETKDLVHLLMKEARLSITQRNKIDYFLRNDEPLPVIPTDKSRASSSSATREESSVHRLSRIARRKTYDAIKESGAYDCPKYKPLPDDRETAEIAKLRLQESMSGMKICELNENKEKFLRNKFQNQPVAQETCDRIMELVNEIQERSEWLEDMEKLGEGKNHRIIIHTQIADRIREITNLEGLPHSSLSQPSRASAKPVGALNCPLFEVPGRGLLGSCDV